MTAAKKKNLESVDTDDEPQSTLVEIPFRDQVFVVPRSRDDWSTKGLAYLSEEKYNLFVKHTLDIAEPGQWATLCEICPRRKDFSDFFAVFGEIVNKECVD